MSEPVRVLQVFGRMDRGGAEAVMMNVYRNLDRRLVQFDFVVHTGKPCYFDAEIKELGGRLFNVPQYTGKNHFAYRKAWERFFAAHPEYRVIHAHVRSTASIFLRIARRKGLSTIAHSHAISSGSGLPGLARTVLQKGIRHCTDYRFACSRKAGQWLFGRHVEFSIMKNAINAHEYVYDEARRDRVRGELRYEPSHYVMGHVGSFKEEKNHAFLLRIFAEALKKDPDARLLLVGDGPLRKGLELAAGELGVASEVTFLGMCREVSDALQAMDVFVFPSVREGFGVAALEAQAAGLPCLLSDALPEEVAATGLARFLSLNQSPAGWADRALAMKNAVPRRDMAREIADAGFDVKENPKMLESLYLKIYREAARSSGKAGSP